MSTDGFEEFVRMFPNIDEPNVKESLKRALAPYIKKPIIKVEPYVKPNRGTNKTPKKKKR